MSVESKVIELSLEKRICDVLQLDSSEVRCLYQLTPSRPDAKRWYYTATVDGWVKLINDLYERAGGGWDPDCSVSRSTAERLQVRLEKALA